MLEDLYDASYSSSSPQLEQVRSFDGDKTKLGNAERFFLLLGDLPQHKVFLQRSFDSAF